MKQDLDQNSGSSKAPFLSEGASRWRRFPASTPKLSSVPHTPARWLVLGHLDWCFSSELWIRTEPAADSATI